MNREIKYNKKGNIIYHKKYDDNFEFWYKCDKKNKCVYYKFSEEDEYWYKYNGQKGIIFLTEQKIKELEYLSREKCSRFEIMDI